MAPHQNRHQEWRTARMEQQVRQQQSQARMRQDAIRARLRQVAANRQTSTPTTTPPKETHQLSTMDGAQIPLAERASGPLRPRGECGQRQVEPRNLGVVEDLQSTEKQRAGWKIRHQNGFQDHEEEWEFVEHEKSHKSAPSYVSDDQIQQDYVTLDKHQVEADMQKLVVESSSSPEIERYGFGKYNSN